MDRPSSSIIISIIAQGERDEEVRRCVCADFVALPPSLPSSLYALSWYIHTRHTHSQSEAMSGDAAYSFSLTTFSRTGKLLQIEYALSAAQQGKTSLGIRGTFYG